MRLMYSPKPVNDKTATQFITVDTPYRRLRLDGVGFYFQTKNGKVRLK